MKRSSLGFAGSFVLAGVVGTGLYWLVDDLIFAGVAGVIWGSGLALSSHLYWSYPSLGAEPTWERKRWVGVSTGLISLAALIGVSPTLPISAELRLGLSVLVIGTGFVAMVTASLAELERVDVPPDR